MKPYRAYIFDLDGTIYRGSAVLPHVPEVLRALRTRGAAIRFLTNNSGQTQKFYAAKLASMGIEADPDEIASSATGSAFYLCENGLESAFVVGMPGLVETLRDAGIDVVNAPNGKPAAEGRQASSVIAGICLDFTYALMDGALQQILGGARFVATNPDATFPLEGSRIAPGAGAVVASIRTCSGQEPFVVGKPNPYLVNLQLQELRLSPSDVLTVGDRLDTDIESGQRAGCDTHLVLTGVTAAAPEGQSASEDLRGILPH